MPLGSTSVGTAKLPDAEQHPTNGICAREQEHCRIALLIETEIVCILL